MVPAQYVQVFVDSVCHSFEVDGSANVITGCKGSRTSPLWPVWSPKLWPSWLPDWRLGTQEAEHLLRRFKHPGSNQYKEFQAGGVTGWRPVKPPAMPEATSLLNSNEPEHTQYRLDGTAGVHLQPSHLNRNADLRLG